MMSMPGMLEEAVQTRGKALNWKTETMFATKALAYIHVSQFFAAKELRWGITTKTC